MSISCALLAIALTVQADKPLVSVAGGFEVMMPGKVKEQSRIITSPEGDISNHFYLFETESIAHYVAYSDYPAKVATYKPDAVLENAAHGAVTDAKGRILRERRIEYGNIPGRETDYTMPIAGGGIATGRSRIFLAKNRLFQVMVLGKSDVVYSPAATAYLDSLKITPRK